MDLIYCFDACNDIHYKTCQHGENGCAGFKLTFLGKQCSVLKGSDWWLEYEEGIRHLSKEALNQVLLTPVCSTEKPCQVLRTECYCVMLTFKDAVYQI